MAKIHVSKDPFNQSFITFAHNPLIVKTRPDYPSDKTKIILTFLYNLKGVGGCLRAIKLR